MQTHLSLHFSGLGIYVQFIVRFQHSFSKFLAAHSNVYNTNVVFPSVYVCVYYSCALFSCFLFLPFIFFFTD